MGVRWSYQELKAGDFEIDPRKLSDSSFEALTSIYMQPHNKSPRGPSLMVAAPPVSKSEEARRKRETMLDSEAAAKQLVEMALKKVEHELDTLESGRSQVGATADFRIYMRECPHSSECHTRWAYVPCLIGYPLVEVWAAVLVQDWSTVDVTLEKAEGEEGERGDAGEDYEDRNWLMLVAGLLAVAITLLAVVAVRLRMITLGM
jgi:hypothetical protein